MPDASPDVAEPLPEPDPDPSSLVHLAPSIRQGAPRRGGFHLALAAGFLLACSSCVTVRHPATQPPVPCSVLDGQKTIEASNHRRTVHRKGTSGFELLADGQDAFMARLAAVEAAQKTLDFQYFIWQDDTIGTAFAERLLAAADRGVKVRMLLDVTFQAQSEVRTAVLAAHPNIQIGFFNPMTKLSGIFAGNPLPVIGEIDRMQSRMHNKLLIADGQLIVGGGRNLADTYFGVDPRHNMRDLDFIAEGPVVKAAAKSFELYWASPLTRQGDPAKVTEDDREDLQELRRKINRKKRFLAWRREFPFPLLMSPEKARSVLADFQSRMVWADYEFIADPPERMLRQGRVPSPVWHGVEKAVGKAKREVVMHAAYLIPQEDTLELFHEVTDRGVKFRILTNSLASIDGLSAMTGIANRRKDVLEAGVALHEMDAKAPSRKDYVRAARLTPMGMHSKGLVVDQRLSFVGSYNMDPRSKYINTETGVLIDSPVFAQRLKDYLEIDLKPENCWRITCEKGRVAWTRQLPGRRPEVHHHDPHTPLKRRVIYWLLTHLPWEDLL